MTNEAINRFRALSTGILMMLKKNSFSQNVPPNSTIVDWVGNVVPEDRPAKQSPLKNIQYCTNPVPRASLPNLLHYGMSPKESEILQW